MDTFHQFTMSESIILYSSPTRPRRHGRARIPESRMKMSATLVLLLLTAAVCLRAQAPVHYDDVGVIVNIDDTNSVAIAAYFVAKRNIPPRNVIRIQAPLRETVTPEEFDAMRAQIEEYLTVTTGLADTLNYFVTTKGVPHRVLHNNDGGDPTNASVDAELMLILGNLASHIHQNTLFLSQTSVRVHPYFGRTETYRRRNIIPGSNPPTPYDLFLTTRLTGLTKEDVFRLIDRSGPFTLVDKDSALWVFDRDPRPIQLDPYDNNLGLAGQYLAGRGWKVLVNADSVFVTDQRNVLGYASWGSNDHYDHLYTQYARPRNHWLPGSVTETYVSTSARNFMPGQEAGQSRIADLITEGCTGASGYVFEPYTVALTWINWLAQRYTDGFNLADSYYMCNPTLSWMAVVVGDPKTSIITELPGVPRPVANVPARICVGGSLRLTADSTSTGNMFWFAGDTAAVLAAGTRLDATHPRCIGSGAMVWTMADAAGARTFTFLNENFVGRALIEARVEIVDAPAVTMTASADTVYLSDGGVVRFTAASPGALSWEWNFGDGGSSNAEAPEHAFTRAGTFVVRVEVSNGVCTSVEQRTIVVLQVNAVAGAPALAEAISIGLNYPNPVSSVTVIPFTLPARAPVRLRVHDALGRPVATLADGSFDGGTHTVLWNAEALPAGVYHCVLDVGGISRARRISILR